MSDLELSNTDDIENIQHKHVPKPSGFGSWKEYWCDKSGEEWPETCRYRGCGDNADGSAHVIVNDDEDSEYIIPMCNYHISPGFSETFTVNTGTIAVYIDEEEIMTEMMDNLHVESSDELALKASDRVQNISGTHACLPRGFGSWKKYYVGDDELEWPDTCRISNCTEPAKGGAHVHVKRERGVFIVPMCEQHNTAHNKDWLCVKKGTIAVPVDQGDTTGPPGTCFCKNQ